MATVAGERPLEPAGLGVGIVFLWALATQLTVQGVAGVAGGLGLHVGAAGLIGRLAVAAVLVLIGEGLRRGIQVARWTTIILALLVTVPGVLRGLAFLAGHGLPERAVLSELIVITWTPWIAWRLSSRRTASWFARTPGQPRAERATTGWMLRLAAWSIPWGVAVAVSQSL